MQGSDWGCYREACILQPSKIVSSSAIIHSPVWLKYLMCWFCMVIPFTPAEFWAYWEYVYLILLTIAVCGKIGSVILLPLGVGNSGA